MDEFNDGCYFEQTGTSNTGAKLKQVRPFLTRKSERDILGTPHLTRLARLDLINDFFSTLSKLHKSGIVVGDISDANLIIRNKPGAKNSRRMIFLDVDSFSYRGNTHPLGPENTPNWFLPEHSQITINQRYSKQTDIYKGALLTNRILHQETTNDEDSFKVIKSEVAAEVLRDLQAKKVFDFLKSALSDVPNNRPTSEKLSEAFSELLARYRGMGKK
jgi:serine/threonine protein kinase